MRTLKELSDEKNGEGAYRCHETPEDVKFHVDTVRFRHGGFEEIFKICRSKKQEEIVKHLENFVKGVLADRSGREKRRNELFEELMEMRTEILILRDKV